MMTPMTTTTMTMTTMLSVLLLMCGGGSGLGARSDDVSMSALETLVQQQAAAMDSMRAELSAVHSELSSVKSQLSSQLSSVNTQQSSVRSQMSTELSAVRSQLNSVNNRVDAVSKSVAFTARIAASDESGVDQGMPLGHHQTVIFDDVITNIGNGYNSHDGIFIAPVNGTYAFFLKMMSANAHTYVSLAIVKNGGVLDLAFAEGSGDNYDQGTSQVTTHLTANDHVWVRQNTGDAVRGDFWTVFTGYLLHSD